MSNLAPADQDTQLSPAEPEEVTRSPEPEEGSRSPEGDAKAASLALLARLEAAWVQKAEDGDPAAAAIVLAIHRHRAALLGLIARPSPALRIAATSSTAPSSSDSIGRGEVKLVVEYVNDWREVLRRRT